MHAHTQSNQVEILEIKETAFQSFRDPLEEPYYSSGLRKHDIWVAENTRYLKISIYFGSYENFARMNSCKLKKYN